MFDTLFIVPCQNIDSKALMALKKLTGASLGDIKHACASQQPIWQLTEAFSGSWEDDKLILAQCYQALNAGSLQIFEGDEFAEAQPLDAEQFYQGLAQWREIELEQAQQTALEMGEIDSPDEFEADEADNWLPSR
ncbi:hypothetical protein L9G15_03470 [Shewanella sp. A3A]|nr:hypothetical protein [Shewanella ferrihydritica]